MAFLGLLLKRTFSLHEKNNIYKEMREEYFEHKQIVKFHRGSSELLFENTLYNLYMNYFIVKTEKTQQIHFYLKIKDCILYIKALFACLISQKT